MDKLINCNVEKFYYSIWKHQQWKPPNHMDKIKQKNAYIVSKKVQSLSN